MADPELVAIEPLDVKDAVSTCLMTYISLGGSRQMEPAVEMAFLAGLKVVKDRLAAADPLRQPREVITGYRDQAGMVWPDEDLGARSSFQPLEPVVEVVHGGEAERLREALEACVASLVDAGREHAPSVALARRALEQPTP